MDRLIVLGTGNGGALKCYNTCFAIENNGKYLLVDAGGGNKILSNLIDAKIDIASINNIFVSHNHIDHIIGVVWLIRKIAGMMITSDKYDKNLNIYGSDITISGLKNLCDVLLSGPQKKYIGERILFNEVKNIENINIINHEFTFFDINARKDKQFGFKMKLSEGKYLTFAGDEPLDESLNNLVKDSEWLLHESFCIESEVPKYKPHEKGHCSVKEASIIAEKVNAKNLVLWHTEDNNLEKRQEVYSNEAKKYFNGNVFVPNDLDVIDLKKGDL